MIGIDWVSVGAFGLSVRKSPASSSSLKPYRIAHWRIAKCVHLEFGHTNATHELPSYARAGCSMLLLNVTAYLLVSTVYYVSLDVD